MFCRKQIYFCGLIIIVLFAFTGCNSPKSVSNPEIRSISDSTVTIAWASDKPYKGRINYYAAGNRDMTETVEENFSHAYRHEVTLDGLESGTQYIYWFGDHETQYFFRTKPVAVKPFSFLVELDNLSDRIVPLLMSEMPEFILSFSKESKNTDYQSIKPHVPVYDLYGQKSSYSKAENRPDDPNKPWKLDWGGLCLIFIEDLSDLNPYLDSPTAHTIGIIMRQNSRPDTEEIPRNTALHRRILDHNKKHPSNEIAFVLMPGPEIAGKQIDAVSYLQLPLVEDNSAKKSAAIRFDVNIEATYAVLLDTDDEIALKLPPLKENRTCEECRRLASTGSYKESVLAYQAFIDNNQGHFQIDDAYYAIADIMDTKLFQFKTAGEWYHKLVSLYPDSTLTPLAAQRLQYIAKYADYNFIPLSRFERIRSVDVLQFKDDSPDDNLLKKDRILDRAKKIIEQYPDAAIAPVIYYWLANQYRNHNTQKAQETYLTLLKQYPDHPYSKEVWWEIGEAHYDAGHYKKAIAAFNTALKAIPDSAEDIQAQIARAKRNLRRRHLNQICVLIPVGIVLLSVFWAPAGFQSNTLLKAILAFMMLLILFLFAGWLIAEQFSSIKELIIIAAGVAAAFSCGFPFSAMLSKKILRTSNTRSDYRTPYPTLFGIMINLIFAAASVYVVIFHTNEHFLTMINL